MSSPDLMIVGRLSKAHGVRGELVVESITDEPADVFAAGRRLFVGTTAGDPSPEPKVLTVRHTRPQPGGHILVAFEEITDRSEAERWRQCYLLAAASELTPPSEGEVYVHELVGMRVTRPSGESLGEVTDVYDLPQGIMLDVRLGGAGVLLPFIDEFVRGVDRSGRQIIATPPEGLFE